MMHGYKVVNLQELVEEAGEEFTKEYLSTFSCPLNQDVENFLRYKAIEFSKQGLSQTHLVMASHKKKMVLVGYFTLANKTISVSTKNISNTTRKRIAKYAIYYQQIRKYVLSAPLIAQIGKNYANGYQKIISGDELLGIACDKVKGIQYDLGGKYVYLECEDKPALTEFYSRNGFFEFDQRPLDREETEFDGEYLVQMLKYLK